MSDGSIPTGRIRRTARLGGLAGEQAARAAANRAANVVRTRERKEAALERWQLQAAEQMVEVLGNMKGAAMKVGQIASFMDMPALPPEVRERMQAKLAELRDSAPQMAFGEMRKVVEADLEMPLEEAFAEWDEDAIAAASIGQVYRARLHDGRDVAVKVQYPGVAQAVRVDMQNLGLILQVAKRIAPGLDAKAAAAEIRDRFTEELDYEHEAQSQRAIARAWRGHPFVVIPDVITELSREHMLVTEYVDGIGFEAIRELPQPEQDRFGEIVFRFFFGCLYRTGLFSGDPHPGNYLLMPDGRVAFLDFGMTKKVDRELRDAQVEAIRLALEGDAEGVRANFAARGVLRPGRRADLGRPPARAPVQHRRLVPGGPSAPDRAGLRRAGAVRLRRPALTELAAAQARERARRLAAADADGDPHARRPRPARREGELAPDRVRDVLRRPARDASSASRRRRSGTASSSCAGPTR